MKKLSLCIGFLVAVSLIFAIPCFGMISGTVIDAFGGTVPVVKVTFTNEADSTRAYTTTTDVDGYYQISFSTSVGENIETSTIPASFTLIQNYPNPFNPSTVIPFTLSAAGQASLTVFNIQGQKLRTIAEGYFSAGCHSVMWNGADDRGRHVSAGVYLYQLRMGSKSETKKMLLLDGGEMSESGSNPPRRVSNGFQWGSGKITGITYRVTITGENVVDYSESGLAVTDGGTYNFSVIRRKAIAGVTFVSLPGGTFQMGDEVGDLWYGCRPVHTVTVSGFQLSEAEITNAQYCTWLNDSLGRGEVTASGISVLGTKGTWSGCEYLYLDYTSDPTNICQIHFGNSAFTVASGKENWPVVLVTWYGAKAFAEGNGWDLPREGEWEYVCRGGHQYRYGTDDGTISQTKANYTWETGVMGHPVNVKSYPRNPFGLYDMSGDVWEWCNDWYSDDYYATSPSQDPTGAQTGYSRATRGGSWGGDEIGCRAANRYVLSPDMKGSHIGFRVARRAAQ
jgi:formylglycine-generating enzyme required for sulfatase activity